MTINLLQDKGTPLERQRMSWKDMVGKPISKLDDDAFTRVRAILMNGVELDSLRTKQVALRMNAEARVQLPASKTVIAARLGVTKETLSRLLRQMGDEGLIAMAKRDITLRDRTRLTAAARGDRPA